ncbi:MAG: hypothetical protein WDZ51_03830 [Pirellulaceae bacterium]
MISEFLNSNYHADPRGTVSLLAAYRRFQGQLAPADRPQWNRQRFRAAVEQTHPVGQNVRGLLAIGGISAEPAPTWQVDHGKLRLIA